MMKIDLGLPESISGVQGQFLLDWARKTEAGPFSSLSVFDRLVYANYEPLIMLAAVAGATRRIGLMTGVVLAPLRNPVLLAKAAASMDALSNDRLTLGLGVGGHEDDFAAVGVPRKQRAGIFEEQLVLMKHIWSGLPVSETVGPVGPPIVSLHGPQILIGGYSQKAVCRVGTGGDGYIAGISSPTEALARIGGLKCPGRSGKPRFVGGFCFALGCKF